MRMVSLWRTLFCVPLALYGFSACQGASSGAPSLAATATQAPVVTTQSALGPGASVIQHVIIVIMENRSFDNLFQGFPGADTASSGPTSTGAIQQLMPVTFENPCDPDHSHGAWMAAYDGGKMDGFDKSSPGCSVPPVTTPSDGLLNYGYVPQAERQPYVDLATQFALADRMFATHTGPSYPGHVYLVAGTTDNQTDDPGAGEWGCDAPPGTTTTLLGPGGASIGSAFPCIDDLTLGDLLDRKHISWKYYTENIDYDATGVKHSIDTVGYSAIHHIRYGPDWNTDFSTQDDQIFTDIAAGTLPTVSWLNPPIIGSDHPGGVNNGNINLGPMFNATLANAIGESQYFNNTAILLTWDDWGGWYDHVKPVELDDDGLGFRVPLVVISKYAKHGYISHVQHEYGSLLHFVEDVFDLGSLGSTDARADDLADMFDFTQSSQTYTPIVDARMPRRQMEHMIKTLPTMVGKLDPY
jgi:phospholipase C